MNDESLPPEEPVRRSDWKTWLAGIVIGDLSIALFFASGALLRGAGGLWSLLVLPSLFLVPMTGGWIASYCWRSAKPGIASTLLNSLWMTLLALLLGGAAFHEGVICLIIVSPIFFLSVLTGALLGRLWFRKHPTRLRLCILPVLPLIVLAEGAMRVDRQSVVTDEIVIHASRAKVWAQVKSFPAIPSPPGFWLFKIGLPFPTATTSSGNFLNAERECIFSHNAIFKEKVVEFVPEQKLTFDILESPRDPELLGHLNLERGQFILSENPDGTTTLRGSTWYVLRVRPLWYFDLWTRYIFRAVHLRVMEDVRRRAEASP